MENIYKFISNNPEETDKLAELFAKNLGTQGVLVCLYGDIGSGKTTFVKALAKHLGINEKVTSPSFVILNEYSSDNLRLYHFDLYRLEKEGVDTVLEELTEYTEKENSITVIEWAEFSPEYLPEKRIDIEINFISDTQREFVIKSILMKMQFV